MSRENPLVTEQIYHIYNRGNEKRNIFDDRYDYLRALQTLRYYQHESLPTKYSRLKMLSLEERLKVNAQLSSNSNKSIVEIFAYCLMPNHFHLILRQVHENGISKFLSQFQNSYTRYYNTKHDRVGSLFQGTFKSELVSDDQYLMHLSRYIHLNPTTAFLVKANDVANYQWSSLPEYLGKQVDQHICKTSNILDHFSSADAYMDFLTEYIDTAQQLGIIKHLLIDEA